MTDATTLADLGVGPNGTIQLELQSADPVNTPIKSYRPRQEYHMPDVITVRVQAGKSVNNFVSIFPESVDFITRTMKYSKTPFKDHPEIKTTPLLRPPF